jgi:hypothetical protein
VCGVPIPELHSSPSGWCLGFLPHVQLPRLPRRDDVRDLVALLPPRDAPQQTEDCAPLGPPLAMVTAVFGSELVGEIQDCAYLVWTRTGEVRAIGPNGCKAR